MILHLSSLHCTKVFPLLLVAVLLNAQASSSTVPIQATVVKTCTMLTPSVLINIPSYSASSAATGSGLVQVKCTQGTSISFSAIPTAQQVLNRVPAAAGGTLTMTMTNSTTFSAAPDGALIGKRTYNVTIPANQWQAPAGNYSRTYTVTITFS
ncbi:hypothetical protein [Deinococcus cellulosilyticus]|uniref:Spore coat protein U domain-containing protein n=1 Tax=Deinococcus cellulosilyticus (strain DSM 18568 / NBRC 106333 / KACC 11606 / 5516J-15) TaxID=1223518 RepID=A0A511N7Q5_DEIC1|nr:hypothetical protein [Deinococcus cellulosilyticus]GEM48537.1 hypothetical protein DC3_41720 [Deinococcus cellulosilyticus NBRC 106333 = KACC 11606]